MSESFATQYSSLIVNQPEVYLPYIESILNAKMHRIVYNNIYPCEYAVLWLCFRETWKMPDFVIMWSLWSQSSKQLLPLIFFLLCLYISKIDMLYESDMYKYIVLQKSRQKKLVTGYGRQDSPSTPSSLKVTLHHTTNVITPNCKFVVKTDSRETGTLIQISKQSYDKSIIKRKHKLLMWSLVSDVVATGSC